MLLRILAENTSEIISLNLSVIMMFGMVQSLSNILEWTFVLDKLSMNPGDARESFIFNIDLWTKHWIRWNSIFI